MGARALGGGDEEGRSLGARMSLISKWVDTLGRVLATLSFVFCLGLPLLASADEEWGYQLSHDLMSPYCPGRTLAACSSPQAAELRDWILEQEDAGRSEAEVREQLYAEFPDVLYSAPLPEGGGEWAYLIPLIGIQLGGAVVVFFLRRQSGSGAGSSAAAALSGEAEEVDPELARIIDKELNS